MVNEGLIETEGLKMRLWILKLYYDYEYIGADYFLSH